jgi:hypothetical protein
MHKHFLHSLFNMKRKLVLQEGQCRLQLQDSLRFERGLRGRALQNQSVQCDRSSRQNFPVQKRSSLSEIRHRQRVVFGFK